MSSADPSKKSDSGSQTSTSFLEKIRAHDPEGWQRFVDIYGPLIFYWCRRAELHPEDASEVFQEICLSVVKGLPSYNKDKGRFRGWLWQITRNKINDHYRRSRFQASLIEFDLSLLPETAPDESADDRREMASTTTRALEVVRQEFAEQTWQAFWRCVVMQQESADVAEDLGLSSNSVRQARSRVLRRLRKELGDV